MSSQKSGGNAFRSGIATSSSKGKKISDSDSAIDQLSNRVADVSLDAQQDSAWEVYSKKPKSKGGNNAAKQSVPQYQGHRPWGHPNVVQKLGLQSNNASESAGSWPTLAAEPRRPAGRSNATTAVVNQVGDGNQKLLLPVAAAPKTHVWNRTAGRNQNNQNIQTATTEDPISDGVENEDDDDVSDVDYDFDDDMLSDEYDSDSTTKSHESRKKNRWFKELFECMDNLTVDQFSDPERRWHCPACKGGPGAIDWYRGLQPLITHAKTKGSSRVKLHRELAQLLDEELQRRGTSAIPAGEVFGKWTGLDKLTEKEIVWPPMVVIMNTRLEKDDNDKWIGMGNQELLDSFGSYAAVRARHSYGPQGHRGMSVLIFEASAVGYLEAERLGKHFSDNGRDRDAWDRYRVPFYPGGNRPLYGYIAEQKDLEDFNRHSQGKSKLKFEIKSYIEMVVKQLKQMSEDNQQLIWFKNRVAKEQRHSKALEESFGALSEKLRQTEEDNRIVRLRSKMHHQQNKEEMEFQEEYFKAQLQAIYDARLQKEDKFEKLQQEKRDEVTRLPSIEDARKRAEKVEKFIDLQDKELDKFVAERNALLKAHEERLLALARRHGEEMVGLEKEFDKDLNSLMQAYMSPGESATGNI